jgi:superfamily II DNA helicase RecQ
MWQSGEVQRLICTSGFGNGINNPHCQHVVHCRSPVKMCHYVQETGWASRDGRKAHTVLFYSGLKNRCNVWRFQTGGGVAPGGMGIMLSAGGVK